MGLNIEKEDGIAIIKITGNLLGENDSKPISEMVQKCIEEKICYFILDLEDMKYLNSTGLSILINTMTKARKNEGEMYLVNSPKQLNQLLEITKLNNIIPQCDTIDNAKSKIKSNNN